MNISINLVTKKQQVKKTVKKFFLSSLIIFGIAFFVTAALMIYNFALNLRYTSLGDQEAGLRNSIASLSAQKTNALILKERLSSIQKIVASRNNINTKIESITSLFPNVITIDTLEGDVSRMEVRTSSQDLAAINTTIENTLTEFEKKNKNVKKVDLSSFTYDKKTSKYAFSLGIEYVDTSKK